MSARLLFDLYTSQSMGETKFHGAGEYGKRTLLDLIDYMANHVGLHLSIAYRDDGSMEPELLASLRSAAGVRLVAVRAVDDIVASLEREEYDSFYTARPYSYFRFSLPSSVVLIATVHGARKVELYSIVGNWYSLQELVYRRGNPLNYVKKFLYRLSDSRSSSIVARHIEKFRKFFSTSSASVITDSEHSKYCLLGMMPALASEKITVIPPPLMESDEPDRAVLQELGIERNSYLLLVSCNRREKNCLGVLPWIDELVSSGRIDKRVVLVGLSGKKLPPLRNPDYFIEAPYVSRSRLSALYEGAALFLFPTLNEGYGMPPIEAMRYGTTSIVSAISSTVEVCGDKVYYFNPFAKFDFVSRLLEGLAKPKDPITLKKAYDDYRVASIGGTAEFIFREAVGK